MQYILWVLTCIVIWENLSKIKIRNFHIAFNSDLVSPLPVFFSLSQETTGMLLFVTVDAFKFLIGLYDGTLECVPHAGLHF